MGFLQFTQTTRFLFSNQNELSRLQPVSVPNIGCYTVFGLTRNVVVVIAAVKRSSTLYSVRIVVTSCTKNELIALALSCKWLVYESVFNYYRYYRCDRTIFFSYANNTCVANFIHRHDCACLVLGPPLSAGGRFCPRETKSRITSITSGVKNVEFYFVHPSPAKKGRLLYGTQRHASRTYHVY